jgi:tRNA (Thr-GGU) A37 N-methylase
VVAVGAIASSCGLFEAIDGTPVVDVKPVLRGKT